MTTHQKILQLREAIAALETIPCTGSTTMSRLIFAEQRIAEVMKGLEEQEIREAQPTED